MTTTALHPAPLPTLIGPGVGPSLVDIEAWLGEVRPTLCSLRDAGTPPAPAARRWLVEVADDTQQVLAVIDHECMQAHAGGGSVDAVEWLHTRAAAVADVAATVLARRVAAGHADIHPSAA